jgi:hypothetical protein
MQMEDGSARCRAPPTDSPYDATSGLKLTKVLPHRSNDRRPMPAPSANRWRPPNTDFDFFIIQVPKAPFGLAWYQGDIQTNKSGKGVGRFVGRFSSETFIVSLGAIPSVDEFPSPPAVLPQDPAGVAVEPVQIYHLGLWFNNASDAVKANCLGTPTTFNGVHNAGIQVLNTANFPDDAGPLIGLK